MAQNRKTKTTLSLVTALIVAATVLLTNSKLIGTSIISALLAFIISWCIYDLIWHIKNDTHKGFLISTKEGHRRILLLIDVSLGAILGLCNNFILGLLVSLTLFCIYWFIVFLVRLAKK